jgi:MYXO-CTERM domain-containing protein
MMRVFSIVALASVAGVASASQSISSTFDTDAEGWGFIHDARLFTWTGDLGNPAGAIRATDQGDGRIWYFSASADYLGSRSNFYGGLIAWDVLGITGNQTSIPDRADVMLSGNGITIGIDADVQPVLNQWTSWSVDVHEIADWRIITNVGNGTLGSVATASEIQSVLADLTGLYIRGEYTNGADSAALDNVLFAPIPTPGAIAVLGLAGLASGRRRR